VRQVVFTDVPIVGRLDVEVSIGLHKTDASIYWKEDVLFQLKIRSASEKFKQQPRPLLRPRSVNFRPNFRNLSSNTVPLNDTCYDTFDAGMKNTGDLMVAGLADHNENAEM
jgi:hypothetical protein